MDETLVFISKCIYLMLPAYFANMSPVIFKKVNIFVYPIDFKKKLYGKPILGKNKTFRGFFFGIISSIIITYFQFLLQPVSSFSWLYFFDYRNWLAIGFLMGFGALFGDSIKSFFKRRAGISPGEKFVPFDQTDFVVGALIFILPIFDITLKLFLACIIISLVLHITVNHLAYFLRVRNEKW